MADEIRIGEMNSRLSALEKRFDYFEVHVDKRFDFVA